ncbi:hypothetical protein FRB94_011607 [Tulasnella sp. JGI-2019a]|nr:hypothetical protein FRB94_011607 [Tulasnella sp. JGI-2019a]
MDCFSGLEHYEYISDLKLKICQEYYGALASGKPLAFKTLGCKYGFTRTYIHEIVKHPYKWGFDPEAFRLSEDAEANSTNQIQGIDPMVRVIHTSA